MYPVAMKCLSVRAIAGGGVRYLQGSCSRALHLSGSQKHKIDHYCIGISEAEDILEYRPLRDAEAGCLHTRKPMYLSLASLGCRSRPSTVRLAARYRFRKFGARLSMTLPPGTSGHPATPLPRSTPPRPLRRLSVPVIHRRRCLCTTGCEVGVPVCHVCAFGFNGLPPSFLLPMGSNVFGKVDDHDLNCERPRRAERGTHRAKGMFESGARRPARREGPAPGLRGGDEHHGELGGRHGGHNKDDTSHDCQ